MVSYDEENRKNDAFATRTSYTKNRYPTLLIKRPVKNVELHRSFAIPTNPEISAFECCYAARGDFLYHQRVGRRRRLAAKTFKCLKIGVAGRMNCRKSNRPRILQPLVPPAIYEALICTIICLYSRTDNWSIERW
jgi:hypothetical protein